MGTLYGRPIVEGDENSIGTHEILAQKEEGNKVVLLERNSEGKLVEISPNKFMFLWSVKDPSHSTYEYIDNTLYAPSCVYGEAEDLKQIFNHCIDRFYASSTSGTIMENSYYMIGLPADLSGSFAKSIWVPCLHKEEAWYDLNMTRNIIKKGIESMLDNMYGTNIKYTEYKKFDVTCCNTGIIPIFLFMFHHYLPMAFDKSGVVQGFYNKLKEGGASFGTDYECENLKPINTNCKEEKVENNFVIPYSVHSYKSEDFQSYEYLNCTIACPPLFVCPLYNGAFALFKPSNDSHKAVFIKCIDFDMKFWRNLIGMPESKVIPTKLGMQIFLDDDQTSWYEG